MKFLNNSLKVLFVLRLKAVCFEVSLCIVYMKFLNIV